MTCSIQDGAYNAQIGWRQMNQSAHADNYHVTSTDCDVSSQQASKMTFTNLNTLSLQTRYIYRLIVLFTSNTSEGGGLEIRFNYYKCAQ